jgi:hypothetical protein
MLRMGEAPDFRAESTEGPIEFHKWIMKRVFYFIWAATLSASAMAKDGSDPFAACHQDMQRLCADVKPGEGRIIKCMMANEARASPACAALLAEKRKKEAKR